mmetsp:Transcript_35498/g.56809  ORF Transcript_35498/g.56809 Transcript_35498/m.56809 type:complete len:477 (-) Transcript_35498:5109-6539(-)
MSRCRVVVEGNGWFCVHKPSGMKCNKVVTDVVSCHRPRKRQRGGINSVGPVCVQPQYLMSNGPDYAVFGCDVEMVEKLREVYKSRGLLKEVIGLVHGEVVDEAKVLEEAKRHSDGRVVGLKCLQHFRSNNTTGGWLSLLRVSFHPLCTATIKKFMGSCGFPFVGTARSCRGLLNRKVGGSLFSVVGFSLCLDGQDFRDETGVAEYMEKYRVIGRREEQFWKSKTEERLDLLVSQGLSREEAEVKAELRCATSASSGCQRFGGVDLRTSGDVFVPQKSSFTLVSAACGLVCDSPEDGHQFLDLGCGSGALTVLFMKWLHENGHRDWKGYGIDINPEAVALSRENAEQVGFGEQCWFGRCDYEHEVLPVKAKFSVILCNPPYLAPDHVSRFKVVENAPTRAVVGGADGLEVYRVLSKFLGGRQMEGCYFPGGSYFVVEIRPQSRQAVVSILEEGGRVEYKSSLNDDSGMTRCLVFKIL